MDAEKEHYVYFLRKHMLDFDEVQYKSTSKDPVRNGSYDPRCYEAAAVRVVVSRLQLNLSCS
jgi:hypothetical protein